MASFGTRFKELRKEKNLTQLELVAIIKQTANVDVSKSSISAYENDKTIPEMYVLTAFADYFGVSIDYILGRSQYRVQVYKQALQGLSTEDLTEDEIRLLENMIDQFKKNRGIK